MKQSKDILGIFVKRTESKTADNIMTLNKALVHLHLEFFILSQNISTTGQD